MPAKKLEVKDFVVKAIEKGRQGDRKGIHTVYSGFNEAFRQYYDADPVAATKSLAEDGVLAVRPCRGGAMIYKADEAPPVKGKGDSLLKSMGVPA